MKILGNFSRDLNPIQKRHFYRCCTLPIALYSFQMWYYNKVPLAYPLEKLRKMQRRATIWITEAFCMCPIAGIKAIAVSRIQEVDLTFLTFFFLFYFLFNLCSFTLFLELVIRRTRSCCHTAGHIR